MVKNTTKEKKILQFIANNTGVSRFAGRAFRGSANRFIRYANAIAPLQSLTQKRRPHTEKSQIFPRLARA